jgi:ubiquinone/menaquinone biosynthesis C-methylase UbiE
VNVPFDHIASTYDADFTSSTIGQLQRKAVWDKLEKILPSLEGMDVLELNCGTGEDAVLFGDRGFTIVATDVSREMLRMLDAKVKGNSLQHRISSRYLDLNDFDADAFEKKFDLVFSNFGGINCIKPESLQRLFKQLSSVLKPGGEVLAVVMPRFCLLESLYFLATFQLKKIFRRRSKQPAIVNLGNYSFPVWYYNPNQIAALTADKFEVVAKYPIGLFIPPSYLERFFSGRKRALSILYRLEKKLNGLSSLSAWSDHYIIELKLK